MILYNWWQKVFLPEINEELDSHLADAKFYYLEQGESETEAAKKAVADFGNRDKITKQLLQENILHYYYFLATVIFLASGLLIISGFIISHSEQLINAYFFKFIYVWLILLILFLGGKFIKIIVNFKGPNKISTVAATFSFIYLINLAIVIFYDIDAVEIIMQNTLLLVPLFIIFGLLQKYLINSLLKIQQILFVIITLFTVSQRSILGWVSTIKCLYITPDNVGAPGDFPQCQQIVLWHWNLVPYWLIITVALIFFLYFIINYLQSRQPMKNKIFIGTISLAMVILPIFFYDSNNFHQVEMLNWQPQIIQAYRDVLGRDPEKKDLDFYSQHQVYMYLDKIKDTLYQSEERKIKINLLYEKILNRKATTEEINYYVNNKMTVEEIKKDLKK